MIWRIPTKELPEQNQVVWFMTKPHKDRGSLQKSVQSIQILCGEMSYSNDKTSFRIENGDELGMGWASWYFNDFLPEDFRYDNDTIIAWVPVEEMDLPNVKA